VKKGHAQPRTRYQQITFQNIVLEGNKW